MTYLVIAEWFSSMGLYLCILDEDDEEIAECNVGHYSDFAAFRDTIEKLIPNAMARYPILMQHSDCDGEWAVNELASLKHELEKIGEEFRNHPPAMLENAFEHVAHCRKNAETLYDCFHTVDEENLFEALIAMCEKGLELEKPISFQ